MPFDRFDRLNDVCSLIVALQALKLAENKSSSSKLSYGWQRAEVLGGAFLSSRVQGEGS